MRILGNVDPADGLTDLFGELAWRCWREIRQGALTSTRTLAEISESAAIANAS
jgi:hypothetical protein